MAESVLLNIARALVIKLRSDALKELGFIWRVKDVLRELDALVSVYINVLFDAEEQQSKNPKLKDWLSKLKDVFYDIDDLIDKFEYEALRRRIMTRNRRITEQVRIFFSESNQIALNLNIHCKIKEIMERLKAIDVDKTEFSLARRSPSMNMWDYGPDYTTSSYITDDEVIGMNDEKKEIIDLLLNPNTTDHIVVIAIVGMAGLGKTTLAQYVYNDIRITKHFELKIWICISKEFDVKTTIEQIIEDATGKRPESFLMDSLSSELKRIVDGRKYLLVMDDVWDVYPEVWDFLKELLMGGARGGRILITTRSPIFADKFGPSSLYYLKQLSDARSWLLFKKFALEGKEENLDLVQIGKEIATKLKGNALLIKVIGRLLYVNRSKDFWLNFKNKELYQIMEQTSDIPSILELSYNHLSYSLKQCFTYCALFPKDHEIRKDEVIMQWVAQGFIEPNSGGTSVDIGEHHFLGLLSRSFFKDVRRDKLGDIITCKMHDSMHDLACHIINTECVNDVKTHVLDKRTRHASFGLMSWEELEKLPKVLYEARNLRTCFLQYNQFFFERDNKFNKIFESAFCYLLKLRALDLQLSIDNHSAKFLRSISKLKHLRYLKIQISKDAKFFPNSITGLYNLEVLILRCIGLKELPRDMKNWNKLNHLHLYGNKKIEFFPNSIAKLNNLETLVLRNYIELKQFPSEIKNLTYLTHLDLQGNLNIEFLPNSITQLKNLKKLLLCYCYKLKELPRDTKNLVKLKHLDMHGCKALTHMPKGLGEMTDLQTLNLFVLGKDNGGGLSELNGLNELRGSLTIKGLQFHTSVDLETNDKLLQLKSGLQKLVLRWKWDNNADDNGREERVLEWLQPHKNLQEMCIKGYNGVKLCNWLSSSSCSFDRLVRMKLSSCTRLQHLPQFDQFPNLKHLRLDDLPNIKHIANNDYPSSSTLFPSLEELIISRMPNLKTWWNSTKSAQNSHAASKSWKSFKSLSCLRLSHICDSEFLSYCFGHVTTLRQFSINYCPNLTSLPESIGDLTSLSKLEIMNCPSLVSLPNSIAKLTSLTELKIWFCPNLNLNRPILEERAKKETGQDWLKIARIPDVDIRNNFL